MFSNFIVENYIGQNNHCFIFNGLARSSNKQNLTSFKKRHTIPLLLNISGGIENYVMENSSDW